MNVTKIAVEFGATIPTQPFGNVQVRGTWEADLDEGESPEAATQELFARIRAELTSAVMPIAQAKLKQVQPIIDALPPQQRELLLQGFGAIQWLQTVAPEGFFAAPASVSGAGISGNGSHKPSED